MTRACIPGDADASDGRLVGRLSRLTVAVISDILDSRGVRDGVMKPHIRPLEMGTKVAGPAATCHAVRVNGAPDDPREAYAGELATIDRLRPGDVLVTANADEDAAFWGELLANAAKHRGAAGFVGEARARDVGRLLTMGFPTFVCGIDARDSLGRLDVDSVGTPITCGGVEVSPGDLILGDDDGVVVIPSRLATQVVASAEAKLEREGKMRESLRGGMPLPEAFAQHKVL